jgi:hypothetical protein
MLIGDLQPFARGLVQDFEMYGSLSAGRVAFGEPQIMIQNEAKELARRSEIKDLLCLDAFIVVAAHRGIRSGFATDFLVLGWIDLAQS